MKSPSIFVWCDPWLVQIASDFFHVLIIVHRVHCNEEHWMPVPFETSSSWDRSTSDYWMYFTYISDVTDYSVKSSGNNTLSCNARSTRLPPWIALEIQEVPGKITVQTILNLFLVLLQSNRWLTIAKYHRTLPWFFHNIVKSYCSIIFSKNWWIMSQ